jgi:hypothetical protein
MVYGSRIQFCTGKLWNLIDFAFNALNFKLSSAETACMKVVCWNFSPIFYTIQKYTAIKKQYDEVLPVDGNSCKLFNPLSDSQSSNFLF